MVATRGQGRKRPAEQEQEPQKTEYERRRDEQVVANEKVFEALGILTISSELSNSLPQSATKKGKTSANKKTSSEDSDTSEYLLENDDQGDSDDDETESDAQPQPTKSPSGPRRKVLASKKKKTGPNMAPGVRVSKRVRAPEGSQVQPPRALLRSSKRLQLSARDGQIEDDHTDGHDEIPQRSSTRCTRKTVELVVRTLQLQRKTGGAGFQDMTLAEDNVAGEEGTEAPAQRAPRRPRPPTKGTQLDRMTKAMGRRMPIAVAEGKRRPHEPVQAAKRYRLKKKYFNGVSANEIRTTSPVECMTDEQWRELVAKWSDPKNMETSEKNKTNRGKVKYHQTTGSRSYVAHLHAYKHGRNNAEPSTAQDEELDVVEAFETCHTSSKHGLSEPAREALSNMEALRAAPVAEGETVVSSVQVVSQTLSKNSSNSFLKNVGIKPVASSNSAASKEELREQLAAEAKAAVQDEIDELKKRTEEAEEKMERTQREMEDMKKLAEANQKAMEENNALLKRILSLNSST
ncbi:uncharacterized protein [Miscanthus floridulus]|uniref:uncharacterized protein n=1 Tax=Miscanthus floridulus TaxID=154761 RepID=UPI003457A57F